MTRREGRHPREEGGFGVEEEQGVTAPAEEQRGDEQPGSAACGRMGGEEGHQERLGKRVPGVEVRGQGDEVRGGRRAERDEEHAREAWVHATVSVTGVFGAGVCAGCQPGPRKIRPARSRQLPAAFRSLAMAAYSWVATRSGLYVEMFLVSP